MVEDSIEVHVGSADDTERKARKRSSEVAPGVRAKVVTEGEAAQEVLRHLAGGGMDSSREESTANTIPEYLRRGGASQQTRVKVFRMPDDKHLRTYPGTMVDLIDLEGFLARNHGKEGTLFRVEILDARSGEVLGGRENINVGDDDEDDEDEDYGPARRHRMDGWQGHGHPGMLGPGVGNPYYPGQYPGVGGPAVAPPWMQGRYPQQERAEDKELREQLAVLQKKLEEQERARDAEIEKIKLQMQERREQREADDRREEKVRQAKAEDARKAREAEMQRQREDREARIEAERVKAEMARQVREEEIRLEKQRWEKDHQDRMDRWEQERRDRMEASAASNKTLTETLSLAATLLVPLLQKKIESDATVAALKSEQDKARSDDFKDLLATVLPMAMQKTDEMETIAKWQEITGGQKDGSSTLDTLADIFKSSVPHFAEIMSAAKSGASPFAGGVPVGLPGPVAHSQMAGGAAPSQPSAPPAPQPPLPDDEEIGELHMIREGDVQYAFIRPEFTAGLVDALRTGKGPDEFVLEATRSGWVSFDALEEIRRLVMLPDQQRPMALQAFLRKVPGLAVNSFVSEVGSDPVLKEWFPGMVRALLVAHEGQVKQSRQPIPVGGIEETEDGEDGDE